MSRAFIFKGKENDLPVSQKMTTDPFEGYYVYGIIEPPYNLYGTEGVCTSRGSGTRD